MSRRLIIHGSFKGLAMINRHFLKPMLKSQLLRHAAIFTRPSHPAAVP